MASPLRSLIYLLPQLWRVLRQGPRTVKFPFAPAELPASYRGRVLIRAENCRGCNMCVRDCPAMALELERNGRNVYKLIYHPERCAYCGQCELSCNFDAIYLTNDYVPGEPQREDLTVVLVDRKDTEQSQEDQTTGS